MCRTVLIPCNRDHGTSGGMALIDAVVFAWKLAKRVWWLVEHLAIGLAVVAVWSYRAVAWTSPRAYRLARRRAKAVRRWYVTRPVLLERDQQRAAVTATTTAPTLADLSLKQEANA